MVLLISLASAVTLETAYIEINKNVDVINATLYSTDKLFIAGKEFNPGFVDFTDAINFYLQEQEDTVVKVPITSYHATTLSDLSIQQRVKDIYLRGDYSLDLNHIFFDEDELTFSYNQVDGLDINIDNGVVKIRNINLKEDTDIRFSASDGGNVVYTSLINIYVNKTEKEPNPQLISKNDFLLSEDVVFDFEFEPVDEIASNQITGFAVSEFASEKIEAFVYDHNNKLTDIKADIIKDKEGKFSIKLPKERAIRSGEYTLRVELKINGKKYVQQKEFTWGVLAINTHKSIYLENEEAFIGIGVLDDFGAIICDADLNLKITDPFGIETVLKTSDDSIKISPECSSKEITAMPDYYSYYKAGKEGDYKIELTAETYNGIRKIEDMFFVQKQVDFDVERIGHTRIFPENIYTMKFLIKANKDYKGIVKEFVPSECEIKGNNIKIIDKQKLKEIHFNVDFKQGKIYELGYEYDAPDVSPDFFLLGHLTIGSFDEKRFWQIANDDAGTCTGTVHACSIHNDNQATCEAAGCSYNTHNGACSGTHNACSTYDNTDSATCTSHSCTWTADTCPGTITADTTLSSNQTKAGTGGCIVFQADNIQLDCAGFWLVGDRSSNSYGVLAGNRNNVNITNCNVRGFEIGIYLNATNNSLIDNNIVRNNTGSGENTSSGIGLNFSSTNTIRNNQIILNNDQGIKLMDGASHNNISFNNISINQNDGLHVGLSKASLKPVINTTIFNNVLERNGFPNAVGAVHNIILEESANNTLSYNNITAAIFVGVSLDGNSWYNTIKNNNISNQSGSTNDYGMQLRTNSSYNNIIHNTINRNGRFGIVIATGSNNNNISYNEISGSLERNIQVGAGVNNEHVNNTVISYNNITNNLGAAAGAIIFAISGVSSSELNHNNISFNNISNNQGIGLVLENSQFNQIIHNFINNNTDDGIQMLEYTSSNNVSYNEIRGNDDGIARVNTGLVDTMNNSIFDSNNISDNTNTGITIAPGSGDSAERNNFSFNRIINNAVGISLSTGAYSNIFINNSIINNTEGINLQFTVLNNTFYNTSFKGQKNTDIELTEGGAGTNGVNSFINPFNLNRSNITFVSAAGVAAITVDYYALVKVNYTNGTNCSSCTIAFNSSLTADVNVTRVTKSDGFIDMVNITAYRIIDDIATFYNNYSVWANDSLQRQANVSVNISKPMAGRDLIILTIDVGSAEEEGDVLAPNWSNSQNNNTLPRFNQTVNLTVDWSDDAALSAFIFSTNLSGQFVNDSPVAFSGTFNTSFKVYTVGEPSPNRIYYRFYANDSDNNKNQTDLFNFTIANTPPEQIILINPPDQNKTFYLQPNFTWFEGDDLDNNTLTYQINITCVGGCSQDNRLKNTSLTSFQPNLLEFFLDEGFNYLRSVTAYDNNQGPVSEVRNLSIEILVALTIVNDTISFGNMTNLETNDTTNDSPPPFITQNDGNSNITINISILDDLWDSVSSPSSNFQFKIDNVSGEEGSFNGSGSILTFTNLDTINISAIKQLNFLNQTDSAEVDIKVVVPPDELPGIKSSTLIFEGAYSGR